MSTVLIKQGMVYDGTGALPVKANVLIEEGIITNVDPDLEVEADRIIDAQNMVVTPGFIDIHRHCDRKPFNSTEFGQVMLAQGITTTVVGNCGISMTPCSGDPDRAKQMNDFNEPVMGPRGSLNICTYKDYMNALDGMELPVNIASMIGTGSVKITVKGFADTPFTKEEMEQARELIESAMKEGAAGVSAGIMYLPECYSTTEEFARLLEPAGRYGGVVTAHIRGEGDGLLDSVKEIIEIGRLSGCAIEISHFKSCGMSNWRKDIHKAIALIEAARVAGQDVTCDFYPYEGGSTALTTMIPPVFVAGDMAAALKRMGTQEGVEAFRKACQVRYDEWDNFAITLGWDRILIAGVANDHNRKFLGLSVSEGARRNGFEDAAACAAYLMNDEDGKTAIINMSMCQDDIDTVAKLPYSSVISDAIYADTDTPHPRMYGAFPKVIREYVMERGILTLEEAVHKMTGLPAKRMRFTNRGLIKKGYDADINIFDPHVFRDHATFENPACLASGLYRCLIHGKVAVEDGLIVNQRLGKNIRMVRTSEEERICLKL